MSALGFPADAHRDREAVGVPPAPHRHSRRRLRPAGRLYRGHQRRRLAGVAGEAAALVATVQTPGRTKTTTAVTMRSRRYTDGLPVAVGVGGEAQSAHDR